VSRSRLPLAAHRSPTREVTCSLSPPMRLEGKFVRQTGGSGHFGVVYINLEPAPC